MSCGQRAFVRPGVVFRPDIAQNAARRDTMRHYHSYSYRGANFRIASTYTRAILEEIRRQRGTLEDYIQRQPEFAASLEPLDLLPGAPEVARRMQAAAIVTGVGPMAAVAGTMAHLAVEAALAAGAKEAIVENGGDIYLYSTDSVIVALYAGDNPLSGKLALRIDPQAMPLAICSSSSFMGHSLSFGACDLATVVAPSGALADAAATLACNLVRRSRDVPDVLERIRSLPGIQGVLIIKEESVGVAGDMPELIRHDDPAYPDKITKDARSGFKPSGRQ
jgi:ApbE superfamily uncharacterized protein (UPF0280 family)